MDVMVATLLIVGAVLIFLEIFLPGAVCGIVGLCCLIAGVTLAYYRHGSQTGSLVLVGVSAALLVATVLWFKYFPDSRLGQVFVIKGTGGDLGLATDGLLNQTGQAHTHLRPSGIAIINGRRVDVVTEGSFIETGTPVKVIATEGMRVVVREILPPSNPSSTSTQAT